MTKYSTCPFCVRTKDTEVISETALSFAIYDPYPVNPGHVLIIPKRHCADYFSLSAKEQSDCWRLVNSVKKTVDRNFSPDGYNLGINNLESAGQTIPHAHIHLIPRYIGDVGRPQGGIRGVIPGKCEY